MIRKRQKRIHVKHLTKPVIQTYNRQTWTAKTRQRSVNYRTTTTRRKTYLTASCHSTNLYWQRWQASCVCFSLVVILFFKFSRCVIDLCCHIWALSKLSTHRKTQSKHTRHCAFTSFDDQSRNCCLTEFDCHKREATDDHWVCWSVDAAYSLQGF